MANGQFTEEDYIVELAKLNPPPAIGDANRFREEYKELVDLIRNINQQATILASQGYGATSVDLTSETTITEC